MFHIDQDELESFAVSQAEQHGAQRMRDQIARWLDQKAGAEQDCVKREAFVEAREAIAKMELGSG